MVVLVVAFGGPALLGAAVAGLALAVAPGPIRRGERRLGVCLAIGGVLAGAMVVAMPFTFFAVEGLAFISLHAWAVPILGSAAVARGVAQLLLLGARA